MSYYAAERVGLYRSRQGIIFGVFGGIAEHFNLSSFWTRSIALLVLLCTGIWPIVILYALAALVMKKDPYVRWQA